MAISVGHRPWWRDRTRWWIAAGVIVAGAIGAYQGIAESSPAAADASEEGGPALVEHVDGTDVVRLTLSASAIKRLDLRTVPARSVLMKGKRRTVVPYSTLLYDANGQTSLYTSPKPRTFTRQRISVGSIVGNRAVLSARLSPGTRVVTVGVQELWGAELGIDDSGH